MKLKFSISTKLWIGFGILLGSILLNGILTFSTLVRTNQLNAKIANSITPSIILLKDLKSVMNQSGKLVPVWLSYEDEDVPQKIQLTKIHNEEYPHISKKMKQLSQTWNHDQKQLIDSLVLGMDTILQSQYSIMLRFDEREDYSGEATELTLEKLVTSYTNGQKYEEINSIVYKIDDLIEKQENISFATSKKMEKAFNKLQNYILYLGVFIFISGAIISYFTTKSIVQPINKLRTLLVTMGKGILPDVESEKRDDEIGQMSVALTNLISGLRSIVSFSKSIGDGNFEIDFEPLSKEDALGNNLLIMRNNLKAVSEEDYKRNWTTGGMAKFAELLRSSSDNVTSLSEILVTELVTYLKANQGSVFVINEGEDSEEQFMELKGCYAWDRQKFIDMKIYSGEGLVGQSWSERDSLYVTDIPEDYVHITSGLGKALPRALLIVPMVANEEVFGVIEIASFSEFKPFEISFVEKIAESTAATISSVRVNERTKYLLSQTQINTEQMKNQEQELMEKQSETAKHQEVLGAEIESLRAKVIKLQNKNDLLREDNIILQNILLKTKKELSQHTE